jgi:peptidoglycan hydrolase CwlO-like protein
MDSGGWIAVLMIAASSVIFLIGTKKPATNPTFEQSPRALLDELHREIDGLRREIQNLKKLIDQFTSDLESAQSRNAALERAVAHWRDRYTLEVKRNAAPKPS